MLHSIRARLTAWYASVLALTLVAFAAAAYVFLRHTTMERVDEYLVETARLVGDVVEVEETADSSVAPALDEVISEFHPRDVTVLVLDRASGEILGASRPASVLGIGAALRSDALAQAVRRASDSTASRLTVEGREGPVRVVALPYVVRDRPIIVAAARSLAAQQRTLGEAKVALASGIPLMILLAILGGSWLAGKALDPVVLMTTRAQRIGASSLDERLPVVNERDELGRMAAVFNDMLARLDDAFEQQRRFMADTSHELRTPVAIVHGEAQFALARPDRSPEELRASLDTVRRESERLGHVVDDLFLLARADAGEPAAPAVELYLDELAADAVRTIRGVAASQGVSVRSENGDGDLPFRGDEALLRRLVNNLLDNAVKYTPRGGEVTVTTRRDNGRYLLDVADTGPGIAPEIQPHIFTRFFRAPDAREKRGAGLGLPIARWIAERHGGRLELTRSGADGSTFTVVLPVLE
ncbi:MAG TPA: ATP-binding protein [Gemmatimonadaceae bacterium]|nr:ATP-binding protein [Gemmatimonadaceae bacterium]